MNNGQITCNYALLRFRPYPDGGEFVNVGLALWSGQPNCFDFSCDTSCAARVQAFFPELDPQIFHRAVSQMADELCRISKLIQGAPEDRSKLTYLELIRVREGLMTFGPNATATVIDPAQLKARLLARHLNHQPAPRPLIAVMDQAA